MFLPNQLPNGLRRSSAVAELEAEAEEMGGGKQRRATDRDEMLAPTSPQAQQQQLQTSAHSQSAGFVARSWDRISGRRRRQKRRMVAEERRNLRLATTSTTLEAGQQPEVEISQHQQQQPSGSERLQSWPGGGGGGNLTGLAHLEEIGPKKHIIGRGMDRLRRSIRRTLQRGSQAGQALTHGGSSAAADVQASSSNGPGGGGSGFSKNYCHSDEIAVRSAACSFPVKYLGCCEVFESRGMSVCESALQHLRSRKRTIKALLYVSGDGVRVVDQENNRGLIVDQTIEKVSFCSPDRHNEKGFAYICRDGATRRWMCHGFHATKDSGERLSHAVGCAFTVCLEKKRKRDAETAAFKSAQALATSLNSGGGGQQSPASESNEPNFARTNQGYRSFRPLSISERRADPQKAILVQQQRPQSGIELGCGGGGLAATPRPTGNPNLFERTGSLRGPASAAPPMPGPKPVFSRFNTLASGADPRGSLPKISLHNEPIWEGEDDGTEETRVQQHFYRTLPHSLPNFGHKNTNWPLSSATSIPPTIPEEDKLLQQPPPVPDSSNSPPADPFTEEDPQQPKVRADDWLEQTFQRAASISYSSSALPRSLTMNWPPLAATQPAVPQWTQFPQSQSLQTAQDWTDGAAAYQPKCQPPTQPPPSLPASCWLEPAPARGFEFDQSPSNFNSGQTSKSPKWSNAQAQQQPATPSDRREEADQPTAAVMKNHSRKAPGSRRIEYQLLQETDVSLSPPKSNGGGSGPAAMPSTASTAAADPFDVNWSQKVLEETTKQRHHNGGGGGQQQQQRKAPAQESSGERQQPNPFGWDMAPSAAVDV